MVRVASWKRIYNRGYKILGDYNGVGERVIDPFEYAEKRIEELQGKIRVWDYAQPLSLNPKYVYYKKARIFREEYRELFDLQIFLVNAKLEKSSQQRF